MSQSNIKIIFVFLIIAATQVGCDFSSKNIEFKKAQKYEEEKNFDKAIEYYYKFLRKNSDSEESNVAANRIFEIASISGASFQLIENSLNYIILHSNSSEERLRAQFKLASFYFEKQNDYESAINHFNKFISLNKSKENSDQARLNIAKSYFYLNNFYQAKVEIEELLKVDNLEKNIKYEAKFLFANVLQSEKNFDQAIKFYKELIEEFPSRSEKEEVYLNLSLCYEDSKKFEEAISILIPYAENHVNPEFIKEKINKIKYLISQQPGARGKIK